MSVKSEYGIRRKKLRMTGPAVAKKDFNSHGAVERMEFNAHVQSKRSRG